MASSKNRNGNDGESIERDKNGSRKGTGEFVAASDSDNETPTPALCLPTGKLTTRKAVRKRPRPPSISENVFGDASESDSDDGDRRSTSSSRSQINAIAKLARNPKRNAAKSTKLENQNEAEDTLDAFMNSLNESQSKQRQRRVTRTTCPSSSSDDESPPRVPPSIPTKEAHNTDLSAEEAARMADEDKRSLTLPAIDHESITYAPIEKQLYSPLERNSSLTSEQLKERATKIGVQVDKNVCVLETFADVALSIPQAVLGKLMTSFSAPTPVQCAVFPAALGGNDVLASAPTGSGKTLAYLVPLLCIVSNAARCIEEFGAKASTRAVVLAPTRELAAQIAHQARVYGGSERSATLVTGGAGKMAQVQALRAGTRLLIATPGRLIDLVKMKALSLRNVIAVAIDEADRMLDLGFGAQVRTILGQIRPDVQCLLLSATLPPRVRSLARQVLKNPVTISVTGRNDTTTATATTGIVAAAPPEGITEHFVSVRDSTTRWQWLKENLCKFTENDGLVMVFCLSRGECAELSNKLRGTGVPVACVHGETAPQDRTALLGMFRRREVRVLVSTDLAARGLDIAAVRAVINYGAAKDWDAHVHRVGRTGRAGRTGDAYTLLSCDSNADIRFARNARTILRKSKREVPIGLNQYLSDTRLTKRR